MPDSIEQQKIEKARHSVFGFFITRLRFTALVIIAIIFFGMGAIFTIPRESDPEVTIPVAVISTVYLGASPNDVEELVTNKIEEKIEELDDVKLVTSSSRLGFSSVVVEFEAEADLEQSITDLKDKVDEVRNLPGESEDPIVTEARINDSPIIVFSLASTLDERALKKLAETIQNEIERIPGVSQAPIQGDRQREFQVLINQNELDRLQIPIGAVVSAIATSNADTPLGDITIDSVDYNVRATAKFTTIDELKKVVVGDVLGSIIRVEDVALVLDDFKERTSVSRISINGKPSVNTLSIALFKRTGGNILNIVDLAKERIHELKKDGTIPKNVTVEVSSDFSTFIRDDLNTLGRSGVQATVLIFLTILFAISMKEAVVSLFAIPLTFLITFFFLKLTGSTINSMTLFALVLSLGLLVDGFIIILEGIFDGMRKGYNAQESGLLALSHYFKPLVSGMLTTISAFVPMLLVSGILGEFLKVLPITMSIVLMSSLFVSLAIVPAISSVILKFGYNPAVGRKESFLETFLTNQLKRNYKKSIATFLASKKKKLQFSLSLTLLFIVSFGMLVSGIIKVELFPKVDIDFAFIDVEMPVGTDLKTTNEIVEEVEEYLYTVPEIKTFVTSIGGASSFGFNDGGGSGEHLANFNITFIDMKERNEKSFLINDRMRKDLQKIKRGRVTVREISAGPPTGAPIEVRITGPDLLTLSQLNGSVVKELESTKGVIDVESNQDVSPANLTFELKRDELSRAGLQISEVTGFLRTAIFGVNATEVNVSGEDVDVVVKMDKEVIGSVESIKNLSILNAQGQSIKLSRVADFSLQPALATIRHRNFEKAITIRANLEPGFSPAAVVPQVEKNIQEAGIPKDHSISFGGEVEDIEQSFNELWNAMILAVILIISILVLQFNSFVKPLVIMMELPLMLIGVVGGMLIFQLPFSFSVFLGLISLAGIAVNDAIVLIDKANRNIKEYKMEPLPAVAEAGESRLQPILLTSITTIISIIPLALADEFWFGLSISIAFGLAFATILQLYAVPMLYLKFENKRYQKKLGTWEKKKRFRRTRKFIARFKRG